MDILKSDFNAPRVCIQSSGWRVRKRSQGKRGQGNTSLGIASKSTLQAENRLVMLEVGHSNNHNYGTLPTIYTEPAVKK
jgi:hypothetical protein